MRKCEEVSPLTSVCLNLFVHRHADLCKAPVVRRERIKEGGHVR